MAKVAGFISLKLNGVLQQAKGEFEYNFGRPKRDMVLNADGSVAGDKEEAQAPWIKGKITDRSDLDVVALLDARDVTVTLRQANGKTFVLQGAVFTGEGTVSTGEAEIDFEMKGMRAEEVTP